MQSLKKDIEIIRELRAMWNSNLDWRQRTYERRLEKHGKPAWYKKTWVDYWLMTHRTQAAYGWFILIWFRAKDLAVDLVVLFLFLLVPTIPFFIGMLVGHLVWK